MAPPPSPPPNEGDNIIHQDSSIHQNRPISTIVIVIAMQTEALPLVNSFQLAEDTCTNCFKIKEDGRRIGRNKEIRLKLVYMIMAASTSNNPSFIVEVRDEYPYPSHNFSTNIVSVKLSNKSKYNVWNTQMPCLLESHGMLGFIDGTFVSPDDDQNGKGKVVGDMKKAWMRSDSLVKGWILGSLSEEAAIKVFNRLTSNHKESDFTAKDAWDELQSSYGPSIVPQKAVAV